MVWHGQGGIIIIRCHIMSDNVPDAVFLIVFENASVAQFAADDDGVFRARAGRERGGVGDGDGEVLGLSREGRAVGGVKGERGVVRPGREFERGET